MRGAVADAAGVELLARGAVHRAEDGAARPGGDPAWPALPAMARMMPGEVPPASVDLHWIPLGAGGHSVKYNGRAYEAIKAVMERRPRQALFHAALTVDVDGETYAIEIAPSPDDDLESRGVVVTGPVGSRHLGRLPALPLRGPLLARRLDPGPAYEVATQRVTTDRTKARAVVALAPQTPRLTWGRDELHVGDMWNSNSVVAWLLTNGPRIDIHPQLGDRPAVAPGWPTHPG